MAGLYRSSACIRHMRAVAPPLLRILQFSLTRSYGTYAPGATAAQPQLDPDYYYLDEDTHHNHYDSTLLPDRPFSAANLDTGGSVPPRGVQWVLIGSPGAKKHVYAEKLSKLLQVRYITMGSLVRQDLSPSSFLYKQIADAVNQGTLVPEEIIFGLLSKRLEDGHSRGETGFILNGIPRTQLQAEILDQLVDIDLVLNFKCTEVCCSEHTWLKYSMSCKKGTWNRNAHAYSKQIKQLEDYYKKKKKLLDIQVGSTPGETWQGLLGALGLHSPPVQS